MSKKTSKTKQQTVATETTEQAAPATHSEPHSPNSPCHPGCTGWTGNRAADPKKVAAKLRKEAKVLDTHGNSTKAAELRAEADRLDPKPAKVAKPKPEPRPVCDQKKKDGTACTARAMAGQTWCTDHRPGIDHLTQAEVEWFQLLGLPQMVALFGWGKVRQAYKNAHLAAEAAKAE